MNLHHRTLPHVLQATDQANQENQHLLPLRDVAPSNVVRDYMGEIVNILI